MALARVTTWSQGQVLTAAALNNEFNNILQNPISLISPTTGNIDFASNQALSFRVEVLTSDPASSTGNQGRLFFNSGSTTLKMDSGSAIVTVAPENTASTAGIGAAGSWVRGLEGSLSTNLAVLSFRQCMLQTSGADASYLINSTAAFTVNSRTAGPIVNGRDQAGAIDSKVVHWYAISTGAGSTTPAGIVSSNAPPTGPAMPSTSGYSAWAYLGASPYSTASSGLVSTKTQYFRGPWAYYDIAFEVLSSGGATSATAVNLSTAVPTNATLMQLQMRPNGKAGAVADVVETAHYLRIGSSTFVKTEIQGYAVTGAAYTGVKGAAVVVQAPNVNTTPEISYYSTLNGVATSGAISIDVQGYKVANGDG